MWLTGRLAPDFKTIADFRQDNSEAIRLVCREFVMLCRKLNLFANAFVAIDESIDRYLSQIASADRRESEVATNKSQRLKDKISTLEKEMDRLKKLEVRLLAEPDQQVSLTDPDARSMTTSGRGTGMVGYNVQAAVDTKHHLIVAHDVTQDGHDRHQLHRMVVLAKEAMGVAELDVVTKKGLFNKHDFIYHADDDEYECPAGDRLIWRLATEEHANTSINRRTSIRHAQMLDGLYPLPDENGSQGQHGNESSRSGL